VKRTRKVMGRSQRLLPLRRQNEPLRVQLWGATIVWGQRYHAGPGYSSGGAVVAAAAIGGATEDFLALVVD